MDLPAFIDIEASGLGGRSYPIEVGVVTGASGTYCALVRPEPGWTYWEAAAEGVHHITRPILEAHGRAPAEVAGVLNRLLRGETVYSDAWGNDYAWLAKLFDAAGLPMLFRLESVRKLLTEEQAARWAPAREEVAARLGLERHRASGDARVLQLTLQRVRAG